MLSPYISSSSRRTRSVVKAQAWSGYSLIELLIAISIMLLLVGGGIAAFITFNDSQTLTGASKQLVTYLRSAQSKARVGDSPTGCGKLEGYSLTLKGGSSTVELRALCDTADIIRNTYELPPSVTGADDATAVFVGLRGGAEGDTNFDLISKTTGKLYRVQVSPGGEIREVGAVEAQTKSVPTKGKTLN